MQATIRLTPGAAPAALSAASIEAALTQAGVAITDAVQQRISIFLQQARQTPPGSRESVIAIGQPPVEACDGGLEWAAQPADPPASAGPDGQFDQLARSSFVLAEANVPFGKIVPPRLPAPGSDVCGKSIPAISALRRPRAVEPGQNVAVGDGGTAVATLSGRVVFHDFKLSVEDALAVRGDVGTATGGIDAPKHVAVSGSIHDCVTVRTRQSVLVRGSIEQATVDAGGDVIVHGGIVPRSRGEVRAGGAIVARFCDNARLIAGGNIQLCRECVNSQIETQRLLVIENGQIVGGEIVAQQGVRVKTLGCEAGTRTDVRIGSLPDLARRQAECEALNVRRNAQLEVLRRELGPLIGGGARLLPTQRERATELMFSAGTLECEIQESSAQIQREMDGYRALLSSVWAGAEDGPSLVAHGCVWAGVRFRFDNLTTTFRYRVRGPISIQARKINGVKTLVAVNLQNGHVTPLETDTIEPEPKAAPAAH